MARFSVIYDHHIRNVQSAQHERGAHIIMQRRNKRNKRSNKNVRRRRNNNVRSNRSPARRTINLDSHAEYICSMHNPFCASAAKGKLPSESCCKTVSVKFTDTFNDTYNTDATTSDLYLCYRFSPGLEETWADCTMDNSVISAISLNDSSYQTSLDEIDGYRVVTAGVRIMYTGPPLTAQGQVRIWKYCAFATSAGTTSGHPTRYGDLQGEFYDFHPNELSKGLTIVLNKMNPMKARDWIEPNSGSSGPVWENITLMATGLPSTASFLFEVCQVIEYLPFQATLSAAVATPAHHNAPGWADKAVSILGGLKPYYKGSKAAVNAGIKSGALKVIGNFLKGSAMKFGTDLIKGSLQDFGTKLLTDTAVDSVESIVGEFALL